MKQSDLTPSGKPYDLHERLLIFACDVVSAVQFLQRRGAVAREMSFQILRAGTSVGSNYEESDGASSRADFIAKNRIALVRESDEIVRILGKIVHNAIRRQAGMQKLQP